MGVVEGDEFGRADELQPVGLCSPVEANIFERLFITVGLTLGGGDTKDRAVAMFRVNGDEIAHLDDAVAAVGVGNKTGTPYLVLSAQVGDEHGSMVGVPHVSPFSRVVAVSTPKISKLCGCCEGGHVADKGTTGFTCDGIDGQNVAFVFLLFLWCH